MEHDFYNLFSRFWWLIFPLFWMVMGLAWGWSRHARANRMLDILKSYADQGKDPPPELMKSLQAGGGWDGSRDGCGWGGGWGGWRYSPQRLLHRTFVFTALAIAFGILAFRNGDDFGPHQGYGLLIPFVIFVALALSSGLSLLFIRRGLPSSDRTGDQDGPPR
jgi:hypothetical protein